ncbi:hypothetical protein GALL_364890 [mine drainage metagenome]|uniref:Uncharacterized protein n=1 Tax=mine drainage metagenome TaxID=410659 RepID=A0A1J5QE57_9ZZZZ
MVDHALQVDLVADQLGAGQHLAGELDFADAERATAPGRAHPAEEEADQLPHRVEAQASGHDRVVLEMTSEKPQIRPDVEFGTHLALAVMPAVVGDVGDAVHHQHLPQRQLGVARTKQTAVAAGHQFFVGVGGLGFHGRLSQSNPAV